MKKLSAFFIILYTILFFLFLYLIFPKYHFFNSGYIRCNKVTGTVEFYYDDHWAKPTGIGQFLPEHLYNLPKEKSKSDLINKAEQAPPKDKLPDLNFDDK